MSDVIAGAVEKLAEKMPDGFDGVARFDIEGEGSIMVDSDGVRAGAEDADVTLIADEDTFRELMSGDLDPTSAYMGGRLKIEGDLGMAMKLGSSLS
ncbi:SCP2 sterol-binding domain-containing protein [Fluviibacterium sp. DFM31]|uniref:SCP2 sterol-binding domain-containing protein n=1 Tax=Meridianimarinicoccus marinus TaxID=3231483 RepID=A0ABV3L9T0_9RHOB